MTDEELDAIEARLKDETTYGHIMRMIGSSVDIAALLAEVRRLRALLKVTTP